MAATFYTLEEAARVLGMGPEDLKLKAQHREVRAFMDGGTWQFRVADVDELARRRGLGSDPELSLSSSELDVPDASGSGEIDLSEFQMGTAKADLGAIAAGPRAFAGRLRPHQPTAHIGIERGGRDGIAAILAQVARQRRWRRRRW